MNNNNNINKVNKILNIMKTSKLKLDYLNNGYLNFNETYINYDYELKFIKGLYISNIQEFFISNNLFDITTKLYFIGELIHEDDFDNPIKTIIGMFCFKSNYYIYCIIEKQKKNWLDTLFPEYNVYISTNLKAILKCCLSLKELNSLDAWFKARITGYTTTNLNKCYNIYDDFLDNYEINYEIVNELYKEYEKKTKLCCVKNNIKYTETLNNILERNNLMKIPEETIKQQSNNKHQLYYKKDYNKNNKFNNNKINNL
jgi:hypothetical protein